jgi:hypothetical protein
MARQTCILQYSGKLGNQIGYRKGKHCFIRQAPAVVRQTTATKKAAADFGTASKGSRVIRHALQESLQHCYDPSLNIRLNKALGEIVRADVQHAAGQRIITADNMQHLQGFQFNEHAGLGQFLTDAPMLEMADNHSVSISLPEILLRHTKALRGVTHLSIRAIALSVNFAAETTRQAISDTIFIKRDNAPLPASLTLDINREHSALIMLEIQSFYEVNGQLYPTQSKQLHALDVIAVLPPIAQQQEIKRVYRNKAPRLWGIPLPSPTVRRAGVILPIAFPSLPEG